MVDLFSVSNSTVCLLCKQLRSLSGQYADNEDVMYQVFSKSGLKFGLYQCFCGANHLEHLQQLKDGSKYGSQLALVFSTIFMLIELKNMSKKMTNV